MRRFNVEPSLSGGFEALALSRLTQPIVERHERGTGFATGPLEGGRELQRVSGSKRMEPQQPKCAFPQRVPRLDLIPARAERRQRTPGVTLIAE
jgi:hypothetical protein